ncbi:serine/threonine-protein kinase haspin [Trachemys scripta elegans]|uniref:serine/threonine-protein kinase haspin n=1 Tax=Trachemys scripta elegans TaxID=31138 RepID=UPI001553881C|nr:serine/threonine-protein kinase haspin [Trachemys scripta elegans]
MERATSLQPRLFRTYARRGGSRRRLPAPAPWLSPPLDRKRLFSSSSASVGSTSTASSSGSEDPDFQPRCRRPPPRSPARLRRRRGGRVGAKENRGPAGPGPQRHSCAVPATPLRRHVTRRRRQGALPSPGRRTGLRARPPLLCSTPQQAPPGAESGPLPEEESILGGCQENGPPGPGRAASGRAPRRRQGPPRNILAELSSMAPGSSTAEPATGLEGSLELFSPPLSGGSGRVSPGQQHPSASSGSPLGGDWRSRSQPACTASPPGAQSQTTCMISGSSYVLLPCGAGRPPEAAQGDSIQLVPSSFPGIHRQSVPTQGQPVSPHHKTVSRDHVQRLTSQKAERAQRTTQGPCQLETSLGLQKSVNYPGAALPITGTPHVLVQDNTSPDEPHDGLRGGSQKRSWNLSTDKSRLQPLVVLSSQVVPTWLANRKINNKLDAWPSWRENDCQQPVSPSALSVISVKKSRSSKVIPRDGDGGTSRKACISGFSSSRWGKQARRCPVRRKNSKTPWQQGNGSFFQEQMRQKGREKNALEMSSSFLCDSSFLNDSQWWARARASLTLHKKKKVSIEESACGSIPCTPSSSKSQLAGYHKSSFIQSVGYCNWPTSSVLLLTPMKSHSVLEVMLTDAEKVYGECQQEGPISFEQCIPPDKMKNCLKIGEGVFGEVFQTNSERGAVALKIVPVEGTERVNGEAQKSFSEILPEMIISKELSLLSQEVENRTVGFIDLYSVHCVQGAYPKHLLKAWDKYHELNGSENDRPDLFGEQQLFMVLEFEFGGNNLENMKKQLNSVATAKSLLHQVTASLAVAEEGLHFEHRDLHWGNILVKKTNLKELSYTLNGAVYTIPTKGIHVNIIDYTLSRMEKDGLTIFCDISTDKELFQGRGDYQFDIYRQMKKENANNWADYHPHSNVLWLHYLADKLLKEVNYKRKLSSSSALKGIQKQLRKFHREVLNFSSASDVLLNSSLFH